MSPNIVSRKKQCPFSTPKLPRYGPGLGVAVAKSLEAICWENGGRKAKSQEAEKDDQVRGYQSPSTPRVSGQQETTKESGKGKSVMVEVDMERQHGCGMDNFRADNKAGGSGAILIRDPQVTAKWGENLGLPSLDKSKDIRPRILA